MPDRNFEHPLKLYNPWWDNSLGQWRKDLPDYRRPIVKEILSDLKDLPQMVSVTGLLKKRPDPNLIRIYQT